MNFFSTKFILSRSALVALALVAFFHLMQLLGLGHNVELRVLNMPILFVGIYITLKQYQQHTEGESGYLKGLFLGFLVSMSVALLFSVYMTTYLLVLDPEFFSQLQQHEAQGQYMTPISIPMVVFIEAIAAGYLFSYTSLQYLKIKSNAKEKNLTVQSS